MSELDGFSRADWEPHERAQHRLLWTERLIDKAQKEAWALWMRVLYGLIAASGILAGLWTFLHGGK